MADSLVMSIEWIESTEWTHESGLDKDKDRDRDQHLDLVGRIDQCHKEAVPAGVVVQDLASRARVLARMAMVRHHLHTSRCHRFHRDACRMRTRKRRQDQDR